MAMLSVDNISENSVALERDQNGMGFFSNMKAHNRTGYGKECIQFNDGGHYE
jgi:hypothetical protein